MINLNRIILLPGGEQCYVSFPTQKDLEGLPILDINQKGEYLYDTTKLPKETVKSVLLKCLSNSAPKTLEDGITVNIIGQEIIKADSNLNLDKKFIDFLKDLVKEQIFIEEKDKEGNKISKGCYKAWSICQVFEELNK